MGGGSLRASTDPRRPLSTIVAFSFYLSVPQVDWGEQDCLVLVLPTLLCLCRWQLALIHSSHFMAGNYLRRSA